MQEIVKPIWDRLDEHTKEISELKQKAELSTYRHDQTDKNFTHVCKLMTETRQELVSRADTQDAGLASIQATLNQMIGAGLGKKEAKDYFFELIKVLPIIASVLVLYAVAHK
jgi:hypothetical protein